MTLIRIQQTVRLTLTKPFRVDGQLTDAAGDVTATLKRADGTTVESVTAGRPSLGTYTYAPPAQPLVNVFTLDWSGLFAGATIVIRDFVEIVGGRYASPAQLRADYKDFRDTAKWSEATLVDTLTEVEQECDSITGQAWVPRFGRWLLDGSGIDELIVPDMMLRSVRAASVAERAGGTFTALSAGELAAVAALDAGVLARDNGGTWPAGRRNVLVEYEHGVDLPPQEISTAVTTRLVAKLSEPKSAVPLRALSWTAGQGGVFRISTPSATRTGIPDVDAAYERAPLYGRRGMWLAS